MNIYIWILAAFHSLQQIIHFLTWCVSSRTQIIGLPPALLLSLSPFFSAFPFWLVWELDSSFRLLFSFIPAHGIRLVWNARTVCNCICTYTSTKVFLYKRVQYRHARLEFMHQSRNINVIATWGITHRHKGKKHIHKISYSLLSRFLISPSYF